MAIADFLGRLELTFLHSGMDLKAQISTKNFNTIFAFDISERSRQFQRCTDIYRAEECTASELRRPLLSSEVLATSEDKRLGQVARVDATDRTKRDV